MVRLSLNFQLVHQGHPPIQALSQVKRFADSTRVAHPAVLVVQAFELRIARMVLKSESLTHNQLCCSICLPQVMSSIL